MSDVIHIGRRPRPTLAEISEKMGGRDRFPCRCPYCHWDAGGQLEVVDRYATDWPPIPYMDLREVVADPEYGPVGICGGCGDCLDPDNVEERTP